MGGIYGGMGGIDNKIVELLQDAREFPQPMAAGQIRLVKNPLLTLFLFKNFILTPFPVRPWKFVSAVDHAAEVKRERRWNLRMADTGNQTPRRVQLMSIGQGKIMKPASRRSETTMLPMLKASQGSQKMKKAAGER